MSANISTTNNALYDATHTALFGIPVTYMPGRIAIGPLDEEITNAFRAPVLPGFCDLITHGYKHGEFAGFYYQGRDVQLTPPQVAAIMRFFFPQELPPIRLAACWLGKCSTGFAQTLAWELRTVVLASTTNVYPHPEGQLQVKDGGIWRLFEGLPMLPKPDDVD